MARASQIVFSFRELAETLVKKEGIHEGHWGIFLRFGIHGANVNFGPEGKITPTAIVPVLEIGIQAFSEPNELSVDAATVNPKTTEEDKKKKSPEKKSSR